MANVKISALPSWTGTAADLRWFVMNNSGETETYKYSGYTSPFNLAGESGSSIYSRSSIPPTYIEDNTGNNFIWPGEALRLDDYCSGNTILGTSHYLRTDNSAGDATTNTTIIGNEIFVRRATGIFIHGQSHTYDRGGITGGYMLGGASNSITNCSGNASGIIGGQSNQAQNYSFQNSTIIGGASNSLIGDVQNTSIFGSQSSQVGNTSYGSAVVGGAAGVINGGGGAMIVGGYGNNVNNTNCSGIYASRSCNLTNSYEDIGASIFGAWNASIGAGSIVSTIIGGDGNNISGTSPYSSILGGTGNAITGNTRVVMLGCSGRTADADKTTYVENLKVFGQAQSQSNNVGSVSTGTRTLDFNTGNIQYFQLTSGSTIVLDATNYKDGATYIVKVKQPSSGANATMSYTSPLFKFSNGTAPTLSTGNNQEDILTFVCIGTTLYGNISKTFI